MGQLPRSFSPDGQLLVYQVLTPGTQRDLLLLRTVDGQLDPFATTGAMEGGARFSPDGRWIAYVSDESGRPEVYVRQLQPPRAKWQVSTDGGTEPAWNSNGRELFYRTGSRVMAVGIVTTPAFAAGRPQTLFEGDYVRSEFPLTGFGYDVSGDGQRFLMIEQVGVASSSPTVMVVLNWFEELKRLVPTN